MATEPTLLVAAEHAPANMAVQYNANTLRDAVLNFVSDLATTFSDADQNQRALNNWLAILSTTATNWPSSGGSSGNPIITLAQFADAYKTVFFACVLGSQMDPTFITHAQALVMLAAYNARFG